MYLVDPALFKQFLDKNSLLGESTPFSFRVPSIVEFNRDNVIAAKVEVLSLAEFKAVVKQSKIGLENPKNKYWIRGKEWELDADGNPIKELRI